MMLIATNVKAIIITVNNIGYISFSYIIQDAKI